MRKLTGIAILVLLGCALTVAPVGGPIAAQAQNIAADWPKLMFSSDLLGPFFSPRNFDDESRGRVEVLVNSHEAKTALIAGDRKTYTTARRGLKRNARGSSRCCGKISRKNRDLAVALLSVVPQSFIDYVAMIAENGTVARDPSLGVRHQLRLVGPAGNLAGGGGAAP